MNALISTLPETPMPSEEAVFFALISGLVMGGLTSLTELGTAYAAKKLHIDEEEAPLKSFGLFGVVTLSITVLFILVVLIFGPGREQVGAITERNIDELGFALSLGLALLGIIAVTIPVRLLANRIAAK